MLYTYSPSQRSLTMLEYVRNITEKVLLWKYFYFLPLPPKSVSQGEGKGHQNSGLLALYS